MPETEMPPDVYADQFLVTTTIWGVAMSFSKLPPHPSPGQAPQPMVQAVVRTSLQHAKVMAMLMRKQLKQWERDQAIEIQLPHDVYNQLGISPEDW